ncbi:MAG: glycosyltransferase family 4 protein [Sulfuricella sp.]|nr:glycosyltransferase family 4 protein [Gammaproteobacteria bacterium]
MNILLSAYACLPNVGSEPGVGWKWSLFLAREHKLTVLTHRRFREKIEAELAINPQPNIRFLYHDTPLLKAVPFNGATALPKYFVWQLSVMGSARKLVKQERFDFVLHLTMGTFRYPSWMGYLGIPFYFGPAGGGERAPFRLTKSLPLSERATEWLRSAVILTGKIDPILWLGLSRARVIFARTPETLAALPAGLAKRTIIQQEIGVPPGSLGIVLRRRNADEPFRIMSAGRFQGWKGFHLTLLAAARLKAMGQHFELHLFGSGRLEGELRARAQRLGIQNQVHFRGMVPHEAILPEYRRMHAFLFPSLHDSGGNVVLEALGKGLPVVCLALGGPAEFVDETCGWVVPVNRATEEEIGSALADAIAKLMESESMRVKLAVGALERSKELSWERQIDKVLSAIERDLHQSSLAHSATTRAMK